MWTFAIICVLAMPGVLQAAPCPGLSGCLCWSNKSTIQDTVQRIKCSYGFNLQKTSFVRLNLTDVKHFEMNNASQTHLPANAFGNISLESVTIRNQYITFDKETFKSISKTLKELYIQNVQLNRTWGLHFLSNLEQLEILNLDGNGKYPEELPPLMFSKFNITSLKELSLSNCKIARLSESTFTGLASLERLNLSHNALSMIPRSIQQLVNLCTLNLSHNDRLVFVGNQAFTPLSNLKEIDLSYTKINGIMPEAFSGLENSLRYIHLHHASLEHGYFETMRRLRRLKVLDVSYNSITEMQNTSFVGFYSLEELNLCGQTNGKSSLDFTDSMFRGLEFKLRVLRICDLDLTSLPLSSLSPLRRIQHIDASHNNFEQVYESFFYGIKAKSMDLSHSYIVTVSNEAFETLIPGVNITFDYNNITNISFIISTPICQFRKLSFRENPISCDCKTVEITSSSRVPDISGTCSDGLYDGHDLRQLHELPITRDVCDLGTIRNSSKCSYSLNNGFRSDGKAVTVVYLVVIIVFLLNQ